MIRMKRTPPTHGLIRVPWRVVLGPRRVWFVVREYCCGVLGPWTTGQKSRRPEFVSETYT